MQEVAKGAVRAWDKPGDHADIVQGEDYNFDSVKQESFASLVVHIDGSTVVVIMSADEVIPSGSFENLLLLFRAIVSSEDIWDYEQVYQEYLDWLGTDEAIEEIPVENDCGCG